MDEEFKEMTEQFLKTTQAHFRMHGASDEAAKEQAYQLMDSYLAQDAIAYIMRQLSSHARLGVLDFAQYRQVLSEAETGLFMLIYVKHYRKSEDLVDKDPVWISCKNLIRNLYSRVFMGRDRAMAELEIESRKPVLIQGR